MDSTILHSKKLPTRRERWRSWYPLIAILALVLASLACISAELNLEVTHEEGQVDNLAVQVKRTINESWVTAANQVNQERKSDFAAAGRATDTEDLLPVIPEDFGELMDPGTYQDQGFVVTTMERGLSAEKTIPLDQNASSDDWKVEIIQNPDHPEQITYRAKIFLDLTEMEGSIFELRNQPLPAKPNLTPGSSSGSSGGGLSGLGGLFDGMSEALQEEMTVELWYIQKAMQMSDPIEFSFSIELPGTVLLHQLNGETVGTVDGNKVTLVLNEPALMAYSGQEVVFQVESVLLDCSQACNEESQPHLIWDGDEEGLSCNCVCEKGFEVIEGEKACVNCDSVCSWSDPNLETDLAACEENKCSCRCKEGYEINNAGTECITTAEAEAEDNQRDADGGPSKTEIGGVVTALILGMEGSDIRQLPGWYLLTSVEREELLALVETLGIAVDRSQLASSPDLTTDQLIRRMQEAENLERRLEEIAIGMVEDEIYNRQRIQQVIIDEIGGSTRFVEYAGDAWEGIKNIKNFFQDPYDMAEGYVKDKYEGEIKDQVTEWTHGEAPATIEDAAAVMIEKLPYMATKGTIKDYYRYKEYFEKHCQDQWECSDAEVKEAHQEALTELEAYLNEIDVENRDSVYGAGRINWAKPGDAYDRAFEKLRRLGK